MRAFNSTWPQKYQGEGKLIEYKNNMGWFVFPYGDCAAIIWYCINKDGQMRWKPRKTKVGGKGRPGLPKFMYHYDLMTIKREKVFEVTEKLREIAGVGKTTWKEIKDFEKEAKKQKEDQEMDELIKKYV